MLFLSSLDASALIGETGNDNFYSLHCLATCDSDALKSSVVGKVASIFLLAFFSYIVIIRHLLCKASLNDEDETNH